MLKIGEIVGSHGVRGEVKIYPLTDYPQRFQELDAVKVRKDGQLRTLHVSSIRRHKNIYVAVFREIADRNQADALRNWELVVDYQEAVPLPQGHYYDYQLENLEIIDLGTNTPLGKLREVMHLPANAVYRMERPDGKSVLIPALKQIVKEVDLEGRRMYIDPMEGLLE